MLNFVIRLLIQFFIIIFTKTKAMCTDYLKCWRLFSRPMNLAGNEKAFIFASSCQNHLNI